MKFRFGRRFWIITTAIILVFTVFVIGRHVVHAVKIKRQINALNREKARHEQKIVRDSALLEQLRYDDYLEEYAREHYHMQRRDERVYLIEE